MAKTNITVIKIASVLGILCLAVFAGVFGVTVDADRAMAAAADGIAFDTELIPLDGSPAMTTVLVTSAPGVSVQSNAKTKIDYSNTSEGYVMIAYAGSGTPKLKVQVTTPGGVTYTYNLKNSGAYEAFPLSGGNGSYKVGVYENVGGSKYSAAGSVTFTASLKDEFRPFLYPNQYVDYTAASNVVKKAAELTASCKSDMDKMTAVYNYVVNNFTYDKEKAATVKSGYLPVLDTILSTKKGICFDYAAVMTGMLRSQNIPCKLVVGYSGTIYHAWINAYLDEQGWVNGAIYFDGTTWKLMDPTFASSAKSSSSIMAYIGDGSNYAAKYLY